MVTFSLYSDQEEVKDKVDIRSFVVFTSTSKSKKKALEASLPAQVRAIDRELSGFLKESIRDESFEGKEGQSLMLATNGVGGAKRILLLGGGEKKSFDLEIVRRITGTLAQTVGSVSGTSVAVEVPFDALSKEVTAEQTAEAIVVGVEGGAYTFLKYKKEDQKKYEKRRLRELHVLAPSRRHAAMKRGFERGAAVMKAVYNTRDMANEPGSVMTPRGIKNVAEQIAKLPHVSLKVLERAELKKLGAEALLAVAQGSAEPAYLLHLTYKPTKKARKRVAVVGKGISFDSGGLSIKPAEHMKNMKDDMAGAATALNLVRAAADLDLPVEVHAVAVVAENMPSGSAMRPDDVVTAMNGKTIEIRHTDAEGRLVLADGLCYAGEKVKPDVLIDVATLTGLSMYFFGELMAPSIGTDEKLLDRVQQASESTGEVFCDIPLLPEYAKEIQGTVSDVMNEAKDPYGGTITAAHFLQTFVPEDTPWLHLDISGPAFQRKQTLSYRPAGGTGFGLRTLIEVLESFR